MYRYIGTPSTKDTGLICRVPWAGLSRDAIAFSARARVSVLNTIMHNPSCTPFHGLLGFIELHHAVELLAISSPSLHNGTPENSLLDLRQHIHERQHAGLRCRTYVHGTRILTSFPFPNFS